jgi:hypothetical protein
MIETLKKNTTRRARPFTDPTLSMPFARDRFADRDGSLSTCAARIRGWGTRSKDLIQITFAASIMRMAVKVKR